MKSGLFILFVMFFIEPIAQAFPAYHDIAEHDQAQTEARQRNLPLAWLGGFPEDLNVGSPRSGSQADLEQMALATLQGNAVVIFFDGRNMAPVPPIVHAQFHLQDDGSLPNGAAWTTPKVVFTNPEVTQILGRVSATEMGQERDVALNSALQIIQNNPTDLSPPTPVPSSTPTITTQSDINKADPGFSGPSEENMSAFFNQYGVYVATGLVCIVGLFVWLRRE